MTIANDVQSAMINSAKSIGGFKNLFDTPMETIQPADLPALAVFMVGETMTATSGSEMAGQPEFWHDIDIGVQAVLVSPDAEDQRAKIVACVGMLDQAMLTDLLTQKIIQNITRVRRVFKFERVAEVPIVQYNALHSVRAWSTWPPIIPDSFNAIDIFATGVFPHDTNALVQMKVMWDMTGA